MNPTALRERPDRRRQQRPSAAAARSPRGRAAQDARREVTLDDKYLLEEGRILLTGVQGARAAAARPAPRRPRRGLHTGTLVSGLPGLAARRASTRSSSAAPSSAPSTTCATCPASTRSSAPPRPGAASSPAGCPARATTACSAMWYGKAPGLDRAADSLRHGNFVGVSRTGGALAVVGDDPSCKSSTLPSASESLLASLHMPVFAPGDVQDVLDLGLHAFACSRASGLWCGVQDRHERGRRLGHRRRWARTGSRPSCPRSIWHGRPYEHVPNGNLLAPASLEMERTPARAAHRARARLRPRRTA